MRLSVVSVELPDGKEFDQYVMRMPRCAMTVVLDDDERRILMMWRHRFIIDRWVWELPGGHVDQAEEPSVAAAREVEEETGWRPRSMEFLLTFQPMMGNADSPQDLYLARGADHIGRPSDVNEAERVAWLPLSSVPELIKRQEAMGAATVIGVYAALADRRGRTPE